jgi:cysteine protease ATG4
MTEEGRWNSSSHPRTPPPPSSGSSTSYSFHSPKSKSKSKSKSSSPLSSHSHSHSPPATATLPRRFPTSSSSAPSFTSVSSSSELEDEGQAYLVNAYSGQELKTFHCERVRKMPLSGLDPSMLIGFLCKDENDWKDLRRRVGEVSHRLVRF